MGRTDPHVLPLVLCYVYYTWTWVFDINYATWDRELSDYGTKALNGKWNEYEEDDEWLLIPVGKDADDNDIGPDPNNPTHFIQYTDRRGNPCPVMLNGRGLPYGVDVVDDNGVFLMSLGTAAAHYPGDTSDPDRWLRLITNPRETIPKWRPTVRYAKGTLRQARNPGTATSGDYFVWVTDRTNGTTGVPGVDPDWALITTPAGMAAQYKGHYLIDEFNLYNPGDIVSSAERITTGMGALRVEKYDEADFLLLGIPLDF